MSVWQPAALAAVPSCRKRLQPSCLPSELDRAGWIRHLASCQAASWRAAASATMSTQQILDHPVHQCMQVASRWSSNGPNQDRSRSSHGICPLSLCTNSLLQVHVQSRCSGGHLCHHNNQQARPPHALRHPLGLEDGVSRQMQHSLRWTPTL
ncbi:hypothetical protein BC831DRAFT_477971 [Entophlyctis helioformis]|nr:hypothetical protein BC831DRAFT_477971 [Entophlyctis helioformis]